MIRATINQTIKTIASSGMLGQSKETCYGDLTGAAGDALHVMSETEWEANILANVGSTVSVVPSGRHNGPYAT